MKKEIFAYCCLVGGVFSFFFLAPASTRADICPEKRLISVTGDAELKVFPDEVILHFGVETFDKDITVAKEKNDSIVTETLSKLKNFDIESKYIQTSQMNIQPRYDDYYQKENFLGYLVRKTMVITLKDINKFEEILSEVLKTGVNYIHNIQFQTTKLREYKDQARSLAIKAAKEKAMALAKELGQNIGKPHVINEYPTSWWSWYDYGWGTASGGMAQNVIQNLSTTSPDIEGDAISLGQVSIFAKVNVSFELE